MLINELYNHVNKNLALSTFTFSDMFIFTLIEKFNETYLDMDEKYKLYDELIDIVEINYRGVDIPDFIHNAIVDLGYCDKSITKR